MLSDLQTLVRRAMTSGATSAELAPLLVGGREGRLRFAVHQRHYEASLVSALLDTFPATAWLAGSNFVTGAAQAFVRTHPPEKPCIAEYGAAFPRFLAARKDARRAPYLRDFAELEWHVGRVALAVGARPLALEDLAAVGAVSLASSTLVLAGGVSYIETAWPIDELLQLYLTNSAPEQFRMTEMDVRLEVRGARGEFRINRLAPGDFVFRRQIRGGATIGDAAEAALERDATFDPGAALSSLIAEDLVVALDRERAAAEAK